jgi:hypothetical protein
MMRASSPLRNFAQSGEPIYARARLERARIEEKYFYFQEISRNPVGQMPRQPEGNIKLALPFDGDQYFSRRAYSDVIRARSSGANRAADVHVGFLAMNGYESTNLGGLLRLEDTYGSVPIRLSQPPARPDEADPLIGDTSACIISYDYLPGTKHLKVSLAQIYVELNDPDTAGSPTTQPESLPAARLRIMRQVGFQSALQLRMMVRLQIPHSLAEDANAKVSKVFLKWPTHTSLRSLDLKVNSEDHPLRYNPERMSLEWSDIPMTQEPAPIGGEIRTFHSPDIDLSIPQPGALYQQESISGQVEVTVDRLVSGLDARLFDATGALIRKPQLEQESIVSTEFSLILGDAFARRTLSPHQQMHFDEVIPTEMRIDDIKTALKNRGFSVADPWRDSGPESRWLWADRVDGPETLRLFLYIEGQRHKARRQRRVPGGVTYRTDLDSGELRIYVYGTLPRESQPVVHEMNALRRALHERFDRLPARR